MGQCGGAAVRKEMVMEDVLLMVVAYFPNSPQGALIYPATPSPPTVSPSLGLFISSLFSAFLLSLFPSFLFPSHSLALQGARTLSRSHHHPLQSSQYPPSRRWTATQKKQCQWPPTPHPGVPALVHPDSLLSGCHQPARALERAQMSIQMPNL